MLPVATFDWPGDSWSRVRTLRVEEFAERYGVPERLVPTLLRKQAIGDRRPVEFRPDPPRKSREIDRITENLERFYSPDPPGEPRATDRAMENRDRFHSPKQRRRNERLRRRRVRRAWRRKGLEAAPKRVLLYACRAKHHEHCAGKARGKPCGCLCHDAKNRDVWLERLRARRRPERDPAERKPTTGVDFMQAHKEWVLEQRKAEQEAEQERQRAVEARGPLPCEASYPIDEETVEAIHAICDQVDIRQAPWWEVKRAWLDDLEILGPPRRIGGNGKVYPSAEGARQRYHDRKAAGRCVECGGARAPGDGVRCGACAERDADRSRRYNERQKRKGLRAVRQRLAAALAARI